MARYDWQMRTFRPVPRGAVWGRGSDVGPWRGYGEDWARGRGERLGGYGGRWTRGRRDWGDAMEGRGYQAGRGWDAGYGGERGYGEEIRYGDEYRWRYPAGRLGGRQAVRSMSGRGGYAYGRDYGPNAFGRYGAPRPGWRSRERGAYGADYGW